MKNSENKSLQGTHIIKTEFNNSDKVLLDPRVHQIELEMQNEELQQAQVELEVLRARYFNLYDMAPVGYLTISEKGMVLETNLTAATLLGVARSEMTRQRFSRFILKEDQGIYYLRTKQLLETGEAQKLELRLVKNDGTSFWVSLEEAVVKEAESSAYRIVISDISERKFAEEAVSRAKEEVTAARISKMQLVALQSQIKPHFMYNALSAIISLCYTDGEKAGDLLSVFSRYLRILFSSDIQNDMVSIQKTLELLEVYIEIEKARFEDRLKTDFLVDPTLLDHKIMTLMMQPLVENAVRHGVSKKIQGGTIRLRIRRFRSFIKVTIADDGVGMSKQKIKEILNSDPSAVGIGIANINQRLNIATGKSIMIRSKEGTGTVVMMYLPLKND